MILVGSDVDDDKLNYDKVNYDDWKMDDELPDADDVDKDFVGVVFDDLYDVDYWQYLNRYARAYDDIGEKMDVLQDKESETYDEFDDNHLMNLTQMSL